MSRYEQVFLFLSKPAHFWDFSIEKGVDLVKTYSFLWKSQTFLLIPFTSHLAFHHKSCLSCLNDAKIFVNLIIFYRKFLSTCSFLRKFSSTCSFSQKFLSTCSFFTKTCSLSNEQVFDSCPVLLIDFNPKIEIILVRSTLVRSCLGTSFKSGPYGVHFLKPWFSHH